MLIRCMQVREVCARIDHVLWRSVGIIGQPYELRPSGKYAYGIFGDQCRTAGQEMERRTRPAIGRPVPMIVTAAYHRGNRVADSWDKVVVQQVSGCVVRDCCQFRRRWSYIERMWLGRSLKNLGTAERGRFTRSRT